jgi:hypothetical protein
LEQFLRLKTETAGFPAGSANSQQPTANSQQLSAISYQLSAISYQPASANRHLPLTADS